VSATVAPEGATASTGIDGLTSASGPWRKSAAEYGSARTYWPVREILQEQRGALEDRPILGLAFGRDVAGDLHPLAARDRFRDAWVELLSEACGQDPLVLLVEDVHWAEAPLLELLERTIRDVRGPLLVVATARPELEWGGGRRHVTAIELEPFADAVAAELVADLPEDLRDLLVQRSEGNPFFVEELVAAERRSGAAELPRTLAETLGGQITALPDETQRLLGFVAG